MQRCVGLAKGLAQRAWASQAAPSAIKHVWCRSRTVASLSFVPIGRRGRVATRETANSASNAVPTWFTRWYATGFDDVNHFHHVCDEVLEQLSDDFNDLVDDHPDGDTFDVSFGDGVLTLNLASHGIYVINKQTPNQQIWLSSPTSGPKRYDFDSESQTWVYSHDNVGLHRRLSDELTAALGETLEFEPPEL
eukprot:m.164882 g.164882  ORF g.164882 m.164882 type:complete len:192 (-) comp14662_c2_seq2:1784-2359(-)